MVALVILIGALQGASQEPPLKLTQYSHTAWRNQEGIFNGTVLSVAQTQDGYLWVGTTAGLLRFDGIRFSEWQGPGTSAATPLRIQSLLGTTDGSLWIGTGRGLGRFKNNEFKYIPKDGIGRVNAILEDSAGDIWIARSRFTGKAGPLCRAQGEKFRCFGLSDGFDCPYGEALTEGRSGSIWMNSYPGVCRWSPHKTDTFLPEGFKQGDTSRSVAGVLENTADTALVGFDEGGSHFGLEQL